MVITISGMPGSGKTILRKALHKKLKIFGYTEFSASEIIRSKVPEGSIVDEFYKALENNLEMEKEMDREQQRLVVENENIILESRIGFMLDSPYPKIDILLTINEKTAVERIKEQNRPEYQNFSEKKISEMRKNRMQTERERYRKLYGIEDHFAKENFNVIIDTTNLSEEDVLDVTLSSINKFIKKWHISHDCECANSECECGSNEHCCNCN